MAEHSGAERHDDETDDELDPAATAGDGPSPKRRGRAGTTKRETISDGLFADLVDTIAAIGYAWPILGSTITVPADRRPISEPREISDQLFRSAPTDPEEVALPFVTLPAELLDEIDRLFLEADRALGQHPDRGKIWPKHNERPGDLRLRLRAERRDRAVSGIVEQALEALVELQEVPGLSREAMREIRRGLRAATDRALGKLDSERLWADHEATVGSGSSVSQIFTAELSPDGPKPSEIADRLLGDRSARQVGPVELVVDHYEHEPRTVPTRPVEELRPSVDRRTDPLGLLVGDELAERVEWLVGEAVAYQELADECYLIRATVERSIARAEKRIGTLERGLREEPSPHQIREALSAPRPAERLEALRALGSSKSEAVRVLVADALGTISPDLFRIPGSPEAVPRIRRAILRALDEELRTLVAQSRGAQR